MTNIQLLMLTEMSRDEHVRMMCTAVLKQTGAFSLANLYDVNREAFSDLYEAAESMTTQIPEEQT